MSLTISMSLAKPKWLWVDDAIEDRVNEANHVSDNVEIDGFQNDMKRRCASDVRMPCGR